MYQRCGQRRPDAVNCAYSSARSHRPSSRSSPRPARRHPPPASPAAPASPGAEPDRHRHASAAAGDAWLIVESRRTSRRSASSSTARSRSSTELPVGVPDDTWGHVLTATPGDDTTVIHNLVVQPGFGGSTQDDRRPLAPPDGRPRSDPARPARRTARPSCSSRPTPSTAPREPTGRSAASRSSTLGLALDYAPRIIELPGAFDFDALSPDGKLLYVAEQVPGPLEGRYQVRAVETATGAMRDAIIVDKRNIDEQMAGWPIDQARRADGMVMTLYRGAEYPFVHALSSVEAWAVCIDLPTRGFDDVDAGDDWGIVSLGQGKSDLAINATPRHRRRDPSDRPDHRGGRSTSSRPRRRHSRWPSSAMASSGRPVDASSPHPTGRASTRPARAASSGSARATSVSSMRYLTGTAIDGLAVTPDGTTLFALTQTGGRIAEARCHDRRARGLGRRTGLRPACSGRALVLTGRSHSARSHRVLRNRAISV